MERKPSKFTNNKQFITLITKMEQNIDIARCDVNSIFEQQIEVFWKNLSEKLNKIGPVVRNGHGWIKIWNDHKCAIMKKVQCNNRPSAGRESRKLTVLTDLEKRVEQIINSSDCSLRPAKSQLSPIPEKTSVVPDLAKRVEQQRVTKSNDCSLRLAKSQSPPIPSSTTTDQYTSSTSTVQSCSTRCEFKRKASTDEDDAQEMSSKKRNSNEVMLETQQTTKYYLRRLARIQEKRLQLEKEDLEERKKFRRELMKMKKEKLALLMKFEKVKNK